MASAFCESPKYWVSAATISGLDTSPVPFVSAAVSNFSSAACSDFSDTSVAR